MNFEMTKYSNHMKSYYSLVLILFFSFNLSSQERIKATLDKPLIVPEISRPNPRLWYSPERLTVLRSAFINKKEPLFLAISKVITQAEAAIDKKIVPYSDTNPSTFLFESAADSKQAVCLALAYHITGKKCYQQKAVEILQTYAKAMPGGLPETLDLNSKFPDIGLAAYCGTSGMVLTYDLLVNTGAFNKNDKAAIESWFRNLVKVYEKEVDNWNSAYINKNGVWIKSTDPKDLPYFGGQYYQNHVAENLMGLLHIAYTLGDRNLVQYCLDSKENPRDLKTMISGAIHITGDTNHYVFNDTSVIETVGLNYNRDIKNKGWNNIPPETGELYDRYRTIQGAGFGYALLCFNLLLQASELAWHNGIDFYQFSGPKGQNLELPFIYYVDFAITADCTLKSGYYVWSPINQKESFGHTMELWELGAVRYPQNYELFKSVLVSSFYKRGDVSLYNIHQPLLSWLLAVGE